jgi:hypothetical protein
VFHCIIEKKRVPIQLLPLIQGLNMRDKFKEKRSRVTMETQHIMAGPPSHFNESSSHLMGWLKDYLWLKLFANCQMHIILLR